MPLISAKQITIDTAPGVSEPEGFLRARQVGLEANTAEYGAVLRSIVASVNAHLSASGISPDGSGARHTLAARHLARHYAAEAVLAAAETGSDTDQTGASSALSSNDLAHWERIRSSSLKDAEAIIGKASGSVSAVYFPGVKVKPRDDALT